MNEKEQHWLLHEKYNGITSPAYEADCKRLDAGEPLGYVIGYVPFLNTTIYLDSHPLIPRTETEYWVAQAIANISDTHPPHTPLRILDLCAGSGCIGVALLHALPTATVDFVEIEPAHHETIRRNIQYTVGTLARSTIMGGNLFTQVTDTYDFICTNPPYVDQALHRVEASVIAHEPAQALYGGTAGLELIYAIITTAKKHLNHTGTLWIEHEPEQVAAITKHADVSGFSAVTHPDQFGVDRYTTLTPHTTTSLP